MKKLFKTAICRVVCVSLALGVVTVIVQAEDLDKIFDRVAKYTADKNYPKALEELKWAQNELGKRHTKKLESFFPDKLEEFAGDKIKPSSVLGMVELKRTYRKGSDQVKLSLMGGSSGAANNPFGQIARFGAMMGGQGGQETLRINGRTSTLKEQERGNSELTMFLDSGFMLKIESRQAKGDALKTMAENLDLDGLEKYLKG